MTEIGQLDLLRPVVRVISAYVANNETAAAALPELIRFVHAVFSITREDIKLVPAEDRKTLTFPPDFYKTSPTLASASDLRKKASELGGSSFPEVQRIREGMGGMRRGRSRAFGG